MAADVLVSLATMAKVAYDAISAIQEANEAVRVKLDFLRTDISQVSEMLDRRPAGLDYVVPAVQRFLETATEFVHGAEKYVCKKKKTLGFGFRKPKEEPKPASFRERIASAKHAAKRVVKWASAEKTERDIDNLNKRFQDIMAIARTQALFEIAKSTSTPVAQRAATAAGAGCEDITNAEARSWWVSRCNGKMEVRFDSLLSSVENDYAATASESSGASKWGDEMVAYLALHCDPKGTGTVSRAQYALATAEIDGTIPDFLRKNWAGYDSTPVMRKQCEEHKHKHKPSAGEPAVAAQKPRTEGGAATSSVYYAADSQSSSQGTSSAYYGQEIPTGEQTPSSPAVPDHKCVVRDVALGEILGEGFFGTVYKGAWQGNEVAVKLGKTCTAQSELLDEAATCMEVRHPNCIQFFGIWFEGGKPHLVTEYMPCGSLLGLLKSNTFTTYECLGFARDAAAGMMYLSSRGIVHRDLATRNLLVKTEGSKMIVKVGDFGLSRVLSPNEASYNSSSVMLPVRWSAPESLTSSTFSEKTDVYSFGVTLWEIFHGGKVPYAGLNNDDVRAAVGKGERPPIGNIPFVVKQFICKCWNAHSELRPVFKVAHTEILEMIKKTPPTVTRNVVFPSKSKVEEVVSEETTLLCVQCLKDFKASENTDESCSFHTEIEWNDYHACCDRREGDPPCRRAKHSANHHSEFPYEQFTLHARRRIAQVRVFFKMSVQDYVEDKTYSALCGMNHDGKVVFHICLGSMCICFLELSVGELEEKAKQAAEDGKQEAVLFERINEVKNTMIKALLLHDCGSPRSLGISIKPQSSDTPESRKVPFNGKEPIAAAEVISQAYPVDCITAGRALAQPQYSGPELVTGDKLKIKDSKSTGTSALVLRKMKPVTANQDYVECNGEFRNYFFVQLSVLNSSQTPLVVMGSRSKLARGEEWESTEETMLSMEDSFKADALPLNIDPMKAASVFARCTVMCKGTPGSNNSERMRAHWTLPQPLKLRIALEDSLGNKAKIVVEQVNPPPRVMTREEWENHNGPSLCWVQCDDTQGPDRVYCALQKSTFGKITLGLSGQRPVIDENLVHKAIFSCVRSGKDCFSVVSRKSDTQSEDVWILVDTVNRKAVGLRISLSTRTSKALEETALPDLFASRSHVTAEPTTHTLGEQGLLTVKWDLPAPMTSRDGINAYLEHFFPDSSEWSRKIEDAVFPEGSSTGQFTANMPDEVGVFAVRLYSVEDAYTPIAESGMITVVSQ